MKSYTDIEQAKKLRKILPLESADMCYKCIEDDPYDIVCKPYSEWKEEYKGLLIRGDANVIPAWSLTALLSVLPSYEINNFGNAIQLAVNRESLETEGNETLVDLVVNMIINLNELKRL